MEVSNNTQVRPKHNATKKCGIAGAAIGAVGGALTYGCAKTVTLPLKRDASIAGKRNFISDMAKVYERFGIDMSKTTVSRSIKAGQNALKHPIVIAGGIIATMAVGGFIGAIVDGVKNHRVKKAE